MRIVMLGPFGLHPKGTMRARALPAARALVARGHAVRIIMPPWHTPEEAGRRWREDGVDLHYVSLAGLRTPGLGHLIVARRMAAAAYRWSPDVIHVFKPKAYGLLAADLLRPRPCPIVVDTDDWEGAGGWNTIENYSPAQRALFAWQERHGLRSADHVTVASKALEGLTWALGVPRERVTYVPNGLDEATLAAFGAWDANGDVGAHGDSDERVDVDERGDSNVHVDVDKRVDADKHVDVDKRVDADKHGDVHMHGDVDKRGDSDERVDVDEHRAANEHDGVDRREPPGAVDATTILSAGDRHAGGPRLLLYTRFVEFPVERPLAVLAAVRAVHPTARLVVVGQGLRGEDAELARRAAAMGLGDAVNVHGWLEASAARQVFASCDVALVPFDDNLVNRTKSSVKLLELLAAGVPVVAEAVGQNREFIADGRSGLLVPTGDEAAFADAVLALLADDSRRAAIADGARRRVHEDFAWSTLVEGFESAYREARGGSSVTSAASRAS